MKIISCTTTRQGRGILTRQDKISDLFLVLVHKIKTRMDSSSTSLYDRIYQRVHSEVNDDDQFCVYLAEICVDPDVHSDDLRDIINTMFKTSHPTISDTRRQHIIYGLLDLIEEQKLHKETNNDDDDDDTEFSEKIERDGECKLCGCTQRITIHHLIPKLILKRMKNAGKESVDVSKYLIEVCRPCHNEIHRIWPHTELAKDYQTVDMILDAPAIQPYLNWKRKRERTT